MDAHDKPRFFTLLVGVAELYGRTFSEAALALYWAALAAYSLEAIERAIAAHLHNPDTGQYCPKPADIVRYLDGGPTQDRAARAWAKVERELRRVGAYASVVFDDPVIMMTVADLGGWPKLCHTALEELPFRAKDFKALYAAYAVQPKADYPRVLPGLAEHHNAANGLLVAPPVLLGDDKAAAARVYHGGKDPGALAPPLRDSSGLLASVSAPATAPETVPAPSAYPDPPLLADDRRAAA